MKGRIFGALIPITLAMAVLSFAKPNSATKVKCMVQLTNYSGEGAYLAVSVLDANKKYLKTLYVLGDDQEWYPDFDAWWPFFVSQGKPDIDAITGATISGGERSIFVLEIEEDLIDKGNLLRFETAVEDQKYHQEDLELPLNSENLKGSHNGSGYIRYVRMIAN